MAAEGLTSIESHFGPAETRDRLEADIRSRGLTVFACIDHAAGAAAAGLRLRATAVLIFGAAQSGTPLMQSNQEIGIELPLKVLIWQDAAGKTWLSHIDAHWLANRFQLDTEAAASVGAIAGVLSAITRKAAGE